MKTKTNDSDFVFRRMTNIILVAGVIVFVVILGIWLSIGYATIYHSGDIAHWLGQLAGSAKSGYVGN